jgi:hypothetical protein
VAENPSKAVVRDVLQLDPYRPLALARVVVNCIVEVEAILDISMEPREKVNIDTLAGKGKILGKPKKTIDIKGNLGRPRLDTRAF